MGNVRKTKSERLLKPFDTGRGYLNVKLSKDNIAKTISIHRLVAKAFIENPKNLEQVNHKDENKQNNNVENLEWCTHKYNQNYGTKKKVVAEKISKAVNQYDLNGNFIKKWSSSTEFYKSIGKKMQIGVSNCCKGRRKTAQGYIWRYANEI